MTLAFSKVAIIGAGAIGIEHLNSLLHCPRAATVAIAELNPQRLREVAENQGVAAYMVDNAGQLESAWIAGARRVGVSAGDEIIHATGLSDLRQNG